MKAVDDLLVPEASSKERILRAAQAIFAQKGFDGARVDEIARAAGVNKALIYYYYQSKEEILHALLDSAILDMSAHFGDPEIYTRECLESEDEMRALMEKFLGLIEERRELFTIVVMELLKDSERRKLVLSHLGNEIMKHNAAFESIIEPRDPVLSLVAELFTGFMPCLMFVLLEEPLMNLSGARGTAIREMFIKAFEATHLRYAADLVKSARKQGGNEEEKN